MREEAPEMHEGSCRMSFILLIKQVAMPKENDSLPVGRHMRNHEGRPAAEAEGMDLSGAKSSKCHNRIRGREAFGFSLCTQTP